MTRIHERLAAFLKDESGATATEYAVMLALIIVVCITAVAALGEKTSAMFTDIESAMP